jgi:hypothetical protein
LGLFANFSEPRKNLAHASQNFQGDGLNDPNQPNHDFNEDEEEGEYKDISNKIYFFLFILIINQYCIGDLMRGRDKRSKI